MLIKTNQLWESKSAPIMKFISNYFNKNILNISNKPIAFNENFLNVDIGCYKKYKYDYIKMNHDDSPFWEIALKNMN